jgi:hypothetical protein
MLIMNSRLGATDLVRVGVTEVDVKNTTILLASGNACGLGQVKFDDHTRFEYGHHNPVDSSQLVVAKTIELKCPAPKVAARKITIRSVSDEHPPKLTNNLGDFPLDQIIGSVISNTGRDRFSAVEGPPDTRDGVLITTLTPAFSTGFCRVIPDPTHVQCDYAYSNTLANILLRLVNASVEAVNAAKVGSLTLDQERSDASTQTFIDRTHRVLVRFSNSPPTTTITVEVY